MKDSKQKLFSAITFYNPNRRIFLDVQGGTKLLSLLKNDFWGRSMADVTSHKSYRPLTVLTYRLNRLLFGSGPFSFHVVNVLLHAWLVNRFFWFVRYLGLDSSHSFLTVILFGLHPVNSESVANCVGRAEILSAHFFLSAIKSRDDSVLSGAFAFLSMLCKEGGVFSLALLIGIEVALLLRSFR